MKIFKIFKIFLKCLFSDLMDLIVGFCGFFGLCCGVLDGKVLNFRCFECRILWVFIVTLQCTSCVVGL